MTQSDVDELVLRFARRSPRDSRESLITLPTTSPYEATGIERPSFSNFGKLGSLPIEILDQIFTYLDFQSLSRLASCSYYSRDVVRSFPLYEKLLSCIYPTLVGLSQSHALHWYSCSELLYTLHHTSCASCGDFAPYFFLLTGERLCWTCIYENQAYWLVPLSKAKKLFGIKERDLKDARVLRSLHGAKFIPPVRLGMRERLIVARDARSAALQVHGTKQALSDFILRTVSMTSDKYLAMWIINASTEKLERNPSFLPVRRHRPDSCDKYLGMGNVHFPSLRSSAPHPSSRATKQQRLLLDFSPSDIEAPYWCHGCQARLNDTGRDAPNWLHGMARRARSRTEFIEHIKTCLGVRKFLGQLDSSDENMSGSRHVWPAAHQRNQVSASLYGEFWPVQESQTQMMQRRESWPDWPLTLDAAMAQLVAETIDRW